jgi:hypothetical protein
MNRPSEVLKLLLAAALCAAASGAAAAAAAAAASPTEEQNQLSALKRQLAEVQAALQALREENRALREHERRIDQQLAQLAAEQPPVAAPAAANPASAPAAGALSPNLRLWGYGEVYYADPVNQGSQATMDLARAVIGIGYKFDELTEFNSEYEVEHAVTSASDVGEFEVEQFYVDRSLSDAVTVRAGLLLMPFGFLNEHHEPTNFYGMQRNFIETLIIPSTWREGGFNLHGDSAGGLGWNVGLTTGFDLSKWDFQPPFPLYRNALQLENTNSAPLQAAHQELALANARHLSPYLALSYYGVPGLTLGAALSSGKAVSAGPGNPRVTLWEAHARWQPASWDLEALYARGTISDLAAVNALNPASPNPIPSAFYGYLLQGAYRLWEHGSYRLAPFVRFERYDLGASFEGTAGPDIPSGLVPLSSTSGDLGYWPQDHDRVWTLGANFYLGPHLVLKGDYQWFKQNVGFKRIDLGLGLAF